MALALSKHRIKSCILADVTGRRAAWVFGKQQNSPHFNRFTGTRVNLYPLWARSNGFPYPTGIEPLGPPGALGSYRLRVSGVVGP